MVFSSSIFLFCFLPLVLLVYYLIKPKLRNAFLLCASLFFYAWGGPKYILILIASILINYTFGLLIVKARKKYNLLVTRVVLFIGVAADCGLLFYFKYFDFFITNIDKLPGFNFPLENIVLPIGISFFTFQGLSYIIDVYWEKVEAQKNIIKLALFKSFFPQLIAGPIVRYIDVFHQIDERTCTVDKFAEGIKRFSIGLGKKVIIANSVGSVVDNIFGLPFYQNTAASAWVGIICYTFQIYFDFSGYSDMAIGLAKMFGFDFMENFNYPYISKSISEFWRRWHISLSSWFRDYLYIPIGGSRKGNVYINLLIVFMVTGLWHGAAWNFVFWGLWNGVFIVIERFCRKHVKIKLPIPQFITSSLKWIYCSFVVVIGWVFFRASNLTYALNYIKIMFGLVKPYDVGFSVWHYLTPMVIIVLIVACFACLPASKKLKEKLISLKKAETPVIILQHIYIGILLVVSIMFVATSTYNPFIYFRF
jgi:alginate O-acetyltransferase complex protein AlgI